MPNRLARESSPYLLQHAENPVDWYPWGPEALERSRSEDRPILLSIGYSACHWCHVMERESFEDATIAALMNAHFVNIKVDREERPDIDQIYMKAVQAMTGGGGWPMTVFLTPDGVPYFGGTYYPPEPRHGMPSFPQVLEAAATAYRERRDQVESGGARLLEALRSAASAGSAASVDESVLDLATRSLASRYDPTHGGFGRAPKFPQPVTLELLLRSHLRTGDGEALAMAVHTLRRMAAGGMRDHLGGGFHRYSVDARWLVPHFEKMLYDNALLAQVFLEAYRITGSDDLAEITSDTLDYVLADMTDASGAFYSARDADSEGEEGLFYVWTPDEIGAVLEPQEARLFARSYDVSEPGNFEGRNILHLPHAIESVASSEGIAAVELERRLADARAALTAERAKREAPFRDEKALTSWNAMTLRALAEASALLERPDFLAAARANADFLSDQMVREGRLLHTHLDGVSKIPAFLEDHAALGVAAVSLHSVTLEARWLELADWLAREVLDRFMDDELGTVFDTAHDAEALVLRPRDPMDNATPSGPSLAAELLTLMAHVTGSDEYDRAAGKIIEHEAEALRQYAPAFGRMLSVLDRRLAPPTEVAIVGRADDEATAALIRAAKEIPSRNLVIVGRLEGEEPFATPLLEGRDMVDGRATAYVCRHFTCRLPVTTPEALREEVDALGT